MSSRLTAAFKESANAIALTAVGMISFASGSFLMFAGGLFAEVAYLLFVPDLPWYRARLEKLREGEVIAQRQRLKDRVLPGLPVEMSDRYRRMEEMRSQMNASLQEDEHWFREILGKLDFLLDKYLQFADKEIQFRNYLRSLDEKALKAACEEDKQSKKHVQKDTTSTSDPKWPQEATARVLVWFNNEIEALQEQIKEETEASTNAVLAKRLEVLTRRRDFVVKSGRILINMTHQLQLFEDTFALIGDEMRARSPEQILAEVEEVVVSTESMTATLEEIGSFEQTMRVGG